MTQEQLAARLRDLGFVGWTRSMVAALETRRRQVSAGDLVSLALAFGRPPGDLVSTAWSLLSLDDGSKVSAEVAERVLSGKLRAIRELGLGGEPVLPVEATDREWVSRAAKGELEGKIAARLGVPPERVVQAALRLWQRSPTAERDRRAPGSPGRKRWASRLIREELEAEIDAPPRRGPPRASKAPGTPSRANAVSPGAG